MFVIAAMFGTARAFVAPSMRSLPPLLAPDGGLPRLIALYSATWQFGMIAGPASSGFLYDVDPMVPYLAAAGCFLVSAVAVTTLTFKRDQQRTPSDERPTLHHALEGLRFIRRQPVLLGAIALDLFAVLFGGAVALLPAIAEERLGVGNVGYGWLRAAPGVGAVAVTVVLAARPVRRHVGVTLLIAVGLFGAATVVFGLTTSYIVAFLALLVLSSADAVSVFIRATIVPLATPDRMRGPGSGGGERVHRGVQRARRLRVRSRRRAARRRAGGRPRWRAHPRSSSRCGRSCSRRCGRSTASRTSWCENRRPRHRRPSFGSCANWSRTSGTSSTRATS